MNDQLASPNKNRQFWSFAIPALALVILGVVVDLTTAGISDFRRAMGYEEPYRDPTEK